MKLCVFFEPCSLSCIISRMTWLCDDSLVFVHGPLSMLYSMCAFYTHRPVWCTLLCSAEHWSSSLLLCFLYAQHQILCSYVVHMYIIGQCWDEKEKTCIWLLLLHTNYVSTFYWGTRWLIGRILEVRLDPNPDPGWKSIGVE